MDDEVELHPMELTKEDVEFIKKADEVNISLTEDVPLMED